MKWQPTLVFMPGETHGPRSLVGYSHGVAELDTNEQCHFHFHCSETVHSSLSLCRWNHQTEETWRNYRIRRPIIKLYADFPLGRRSVPKTPALFKGQLYIFNRYPSISLFYICKFSHLLCNNALLVCSLTYKQI